MSAKRLHRSAAALLILSHGSLFLGLASDERRLMIPLLVVAAALLALSLVVWMKALRRTAEEAKQNGPGPGEST
jgi:hypothetical protein